MFKFEDDTSFIQSLFLFLSRSSKLDAFSFAASVSFTSLAMVIFRMSPSLLSVGNKKEGY